MTNEYADIVEIQEHPSVRVVNHLLRHGYRLLTSGTVHHQKHGKDLRRLVYTVGRTVDVPRLEVTAELLEQLFRPAEAPAVPE